MNTWHKDLAATFKDLAATFDADQIVEFDRNPEITEKIEGYVVGTSDLFLMIHVLEPNFMDLNGYTVMRHADIQHYEVKDNNEMFLNRALKLKGIQPVQQPKIDLSSFPALLSSVNAQFSLITIHQETTDDEICFIGRALKMTDKTVTLNEISPAAIWNQTRRYKFKDITRVDFGGGYEESLALVAEHDTK